jgi:prevent-host-death family protein
MRRVDLNQDIRPLSEFRANAASFIQQVHNTKRPMVITHRGRSAAVLIDVFEYESLIEKLELLQDVQIAENQLKKGKGLKHEAAKKKIFESLKR